MTVKELKFSLQIIDNALFPRKCGTLAGYLKEVLK